MREAIHASIAEAGHATDFADNCTGLGNPPCWISRYMDVRLRPVRRKTSGRRRSRSVEGLFAQAGNALRTARPGTDGTCWAVTDVFRFIWTVLNFAGNGGDGLGRL